MKPLPSDKTRMFKASSRIKKNRIKSKGRFRYIMSVWEEWRKEFFSHNAIQKLDFINFGFDYKKA